MSSKSSWTCLYCSKIFKDPIQLPCNDNICAHHLTESNVLEKKKVKCPKCAQMFDSCRTEDFKPNKLVRQFLDKEIFLSDEEKRLKAKLEEGLEMLHQLWKEFSQSKSKASLEFQDYFQEIKRQIGVQRERLKEKIDKIAADMIEQTNKYETSYLESMNTKAERSPKILRDQLNDLNETFRDPSILLEKIKQMQQDQEKTIADLKFKLTEMSQIKKHLKSNEFKPSFLKGANYFGHLNLKEYSSNKLFESKIVTIEQAIELIKLCKFSSRDKWRLLYRGSRDGFGAKDFHSKCDNHAYTLTIMKAKEKDFIFGGFTAATWTSSNQFKFDPNAFLFSLTNKDNQPCKMNVTNQKYSIYCWSKCGPIFGGHCGQGAHDICIVSDADQETGSYSSLGNAYKNSKYAYGTNEVKSFLAGSYQFQLNEIEVYQMVNVFDRN